MNDMHDMITCDLDQEFVLTQAGYDAMDKKLREERGCEVGKPVKGFETAIYEYWYVAGYFEKADKPVEGYA